MNKREISFTISFNVPKWVPSIRDMKYVWNTVKFRITRPYRCMDTGVPLNFDHASYEWKGQGLPRILIDIQHPLSRNAAIARLKAVFARGGWDDQDDRLRVKTRQCSACNRMVPTLGMGKGDFKFHICLTYWNGFVVCQDCLEHTIKSGAEAGFSSIRYGGKNYLVNGKRALIERKPQITADHDIPVVCKPSGW